MLVIKLYRLLLFFFTLFFILLSSFIGKDIYNSYKYYKTLQRFYQFYIPKVYKIKNLIYNLAIERGLTFLYLTYKENEYILNTNKNIFFLSPDEFFLNLKDIQTKLNKQRRKVDNILKNIDDKNLVIEIDKIRKLVNKNEIKAIESLKKYTNLINLLVNNIYFSYKENYKKLNYKEKIFFLTKMLEYKNILGQNRALVSAITFYSHTLLFEKLNKIRTYFLMNVGKAKILYTEIKNYFDPEEKKQFLKVYYSNLYKKINFFEESIVNFDIEKLQKYKAIEIFEIYSKFIENLKFIINDSLHFLRTNSLKLSNWNFLIFIVLSVIFVNISVLFIIFFYKFSAEIKKIRKIQNYICQYNFENKNL